ncbi:nitrate reductase molybdenum cofactor assembly chaperone [Paenibacillus sp. PR3]|uniref:Nitrate reductase molybdenum cofactor assembly chaperone n=1 Tax=Paenibacillus terricola TaxID=2763503 RepID=A0ABR8MRE8_9BACL|nr:nitrate reductase molybdenum cofactor assembly chaperone [Paenibacillus terricola]MBD3918566.1 nitrate reductase molybdenum cofactor assembly chaperone [Paenibacillus terricola]
MAMDWDQSQQLFGLLCCLLRYPDREWFAQLNELREDAQWLQDDDARRTVLAFIEQAASSNELAWQDRYVRTFDFGRKSNLYLTYGQHGEERERSKALLELKRLYAEAGFELTSSELPDYLPLMLEFVSHAGVKHSAEVIGKYQQTLSAIHEELKGRQDSYAGLFELLLAMVTVLAAAFASGQQLAGSGVE